MTDIQFKYAGQSGIVSEGDAARLSFATNQLREGAYFRGRLASPLVLRDAFAALREVVMSDLSYRPRDREAFVAWLAEQDRAFLAKIDSLRSDVRLEIEAREARLAELDAERRELRRPFLDARDAYLDFAVERAFEMSYVLDPVCSVHPDELAFEVFSRDESSYGRVSLKYDLFAEIDAFECGTTNVDFSAGLHRQLSRMRSYRDTRFDIHASGFTVTNASDGVHHEKQVPLPQSWLNGFLQVQSTMTLSLTRLRLAPIDLFNICRFLVRRRARSSPRALRWELRPGERTRVVFEPWETELSLSEVSTYEGETPQTIRTWGRRRLAVLEPLLPRVRHVDVCLAGHGLPTIYVCDLGDVSFTLGLSGWTDQDWAGTARFELLSRRLDADTAELDAVHDALRETRRGDANDIAARTGLGMEKTRACLSMLCQVGRAMYDLGSDVYRYRALLHGPFSAEAAVAKATAQAEDAHPAAQEARKTFEAGRARFTARRPTKSGYKLSGSVRGSDDERVRPLLSVDHEGKIIDATCTCRAFKKHRLTKGPCEHMLALRLAHMDRLAAEDAAKANSSAGGSPD